MKTNLQLRAVRENHGLTMRELAQGISIAYHTYANYENGGRRPPYDVLIKIADFLQVTTDELLGRSPLSAAGFTFTPGGSDSVLAVSHGENSYVASKDFVSAWEKNLNYFFKIWADSVFLPALKCEDERLKTDKACVEQLTKILNELQQKE